MTDDWYTSDYPELRPGPPWVMEEMIRAQAALPDGLAALDGGARDPRRCGSGPGRRRRDRRRRLRHLRARCDGSRRAARDGLATSRPRGPADPRAAGPRRCARSLAGRPRHRRQPRRRDTRHLARARPRASRRRRHRGDHRARRARTSRRRPTTFSRHRSTIARGATRWPTRAPSSPGAAIAYAESRRAWPAVARAPRSKPPSPPTALEPPGERLHPVTASAVRRDRVGSHQRPRARAQDRGGRANRGDRPSPRDPAPRAPGRLRAGVDANRLPRRRPQPRRSRTADGSCSRPRPPPRSAFDDRHRAPGDPHAPARFRRRRRAWSRRRRRRRASS